ncbi:MAG: amidohydrolase [Bacillota bacterium]|nr:amidohydrolase [Bacillota bacterium]
MHLTDEERLICDAIDQQKDRLAAISDQVHAFSEMGYQEFKSSDLLVSALRDAGLAVTTGTSGLPTAFHGVLKGASPGPSIAFLAEYDALPGLGHACGHNLIGTAALGAVIGLRAVEHLLPGDAHVFGTPAEEGFAPGAGGKVVMFNEGAFQGMDAVLMIHPGEPFCGGGPSLARENFRLIFYGRRPKTGEPRWEAADSQDGLMLTQMAIHVLRQHVSPDVVIQWIIEKGGENPNIIPVESHARMYVRANTMDTVKKVVARVMDCAKGAASAIGGRVEYHRHAQPYEEVVPSPTLNRTLVEALLDIGVPSEDVSLTPKQKQPTHSNDLGIISKHIPSLSASIIAGPRGLVLHTVEATEATKSKTAHQGMIVGAKAMALMAWRLARQPDLLERAKQELKMAVG